MNEQGLTYTESFVVAWLLLWRGTLIGFSLAALFGFIVGFLSEPLGLPTELFRFISAAGGAARSMGLGVIELT